MFENYDLDLELPGDGGLDPARIKKLALEKVRRPKPRVLAGGKVLRTALIAAAIACFMSITAFAAAYYHMNAEKTAPGSTQIYEWHVMGNKEAQKMTYNASMVLRFETGPESPFYVFRPQWLPELPEEMPCTNRDLYTFLKDHAAEMLGERGWLEPDENQEKRDAMTKEALQKSGLAEEAEDWYVSFKADDGWDIPFDIAVVSPAELCNIDYLVGYDGSGIQILRDETDEQWQTLWIQEDKTNLDWVQKLDDNPLWHSNYVLRYNTQEGYLVRVSGTLSCETLHKIAENLEITATGLTDRVNPDDPDGNHFTILALGRG